MDNVAEKDNSEAEGSREDSWKDSSVHVQLEGPSTAERQEENEKKAEVGTLEKTPEGDCERQGEQKHQ